MLKIFLILINSAAGCCCFFLSSYAFADGRKTELPQIANSLRNPGNTILPGTTPTVINFEDCASRSAINRNAENNAIVSLRVRVYRITVGQSRFNKHNVRDVRFETGPTARIDFRRPIRDISRVSCPA